MLDGANPTPQIPQPRGLTHDGPVHVAVISGPTAVGKGTVVAELLRRHPDLMVSRSTTTRPPRPHEVDGVQYIAVQSGWGVDAQRMQDSLAKVSADYRFEVPQGGVLWVFALRRR